MPRFIQSLRQTSFQLWLLASFLVLVFMTCGASRADVQSLILLRPVSIIVCGVAAITLRREHLFERRWLAGGFLVISMLAVFNIVPLPAGVWAELPGRQLILDIDRLASIGATPRPMTLLPENGVNSIFSLFVPLAVLLLGIQLNNKDFNRLLPLLIACGALSGLVGLIQVAGNPEGPQYLYQVTNKGSAVGLFANRNHASTLLACLFPMLAAFAVSRAGKPEGQRSRQLVAIMIAVVLIPLILVTGSRSGLLLSLVGLTGAAILYVRRRKESDPKETRPGPRYHQHTGLLAGLIVVTSLVFVTIYFARAEAIDRVFDTAAGNGNRADFWLTSVNLFAQYFPWGFGAGSFVEAFKVVEPNSVLDASYLNHAHNDWIEIVVTFGLPGLLALAFAVCFYIYRSVRIWQRGSRERHSGTFARMAGIGIAILAIASISDYPLRTPTLMCVFALLAIWFVKPRSEAESS